MTGRTPRADNAMEGMDPGQQIHIRMTGRTIRISRHKVTVIRDMDHSVIIVAVKTGHSAATGDDISHRLIRGINIIGPRYRSAGEMAGRTSTISVDRNIMTILNFCPILNIAGMTSRTRLPIGKVGANTYGMAMYMSIRVGGVTG